VRNAWRSLCVLCVLALIFVSPGVLTARAQETSRAEAVLRSMSAEERVGQLFLVTFEGANLDQDSQIFALIADHHIGGVVLTAENNNFLHEDTAAATRQMTQALQTIAWESSSEVITVEDTGTTTGRTYVPLLIGLKQWGNGYPGDAIISGLTKLPSQMAIGASWDLTLANRAGESFGQELTSLGFNLYLGPNLDVLENANNEAAISLGVNAFGGNPFWVGEMGRAFVSGLHTGSSNRMLVVAQNFPGTGNSDRSPEQEISTVRKSLEQLRQVELVPYFSVTAPDLGNPGRVDALMVSHNRYQGFQGNIRATTRPISFDSNALQAIMSLPEFDGWRENGGLLISDDLGSGAVRRFFDPNDTSFDARQIARNAFLAGNDILFLDNFIANGDPNVFTTIAATIESFVQKYREDPAFARRVDSSVLRILEAKLALYDDFSFPRVSNLPGEIESLGEAHEVTFDVAQASVTLINPSPQDLDTVLPAPPLWYEDLIIFTDVRTVSQCDACLLAPDVGTNAFANALISLYGPQSGGQILQNRLYSYSFGQLADYLDDLESEAADLIDSNLRVADWVVFNVIGSQSAVPCFQCAPTHSG
jgi:beta-N-acetylhexosaminidase